MQIKFTMPARIGIIGKLMESKGGIADDGRLIARDIFRKIEVSEDESAEFEKLIEGVGVFRDNRKMKVMPEIPVDLTAAEMRKLVNVIKNSQWGIQDDEWFEPLLEQITAGLAAKPPSNPQLVSVSYEEK